MPTSGACRWTGFARRTRLPPEKLFASIREEMDPAFSPDGKSIAFISNRSGHWNLWTGNADGSGLRELAAQSLLPVPSRMVSRQP